jgi:hypothetical protein
MPKVVAIVDDIAVTAATVRWSARGDGWAIFKIKSGTRAGFWTNFHNRANSSESEYGVSHGYRPLAAGTRP